MKNKIIIGLAGFSRREFRNREAERRQEASRHFTSASVGANSGIVRRVWNINHAGGNTSWLQSARIQES